MLGFQRCLKQLWKAPVIGLSDVSAASLFIFSSILSMDMKQACNWKLDKLFRALLEHPSHKVRSLNQLRMHRRTQIPPVSRIKRNTFEMPNCKL